MKSTVMNMKEQLTTNTRRNNLQKPNKEEKKKNKILLFYQFSNQININIQIKRETTTWSIGRDGVHEIGVP